MLSLYTQIALIEALVCLQKHYLLHLNTCNVVHLVCMLASTALRDLYLQIATTLTCTNTTPSRCCGPATLKMYNARIRVGLHLGLQ